MNKLIISTLLILLFASCSASAERNEKRDTKNSAKTEKVTHKTIKLTKAEFLEKVYNFESNPDEWKYEGDKPAIIDFYADWCRPCRMIAPVLEELAAEYGDDIVIYKVDTQKERELAAAFNIQSLPSILFIPLNGKPQLAKGALPKESFIKAIESVLKVKK